MRDAIRDLDYFVHYVDEVKFVIDRSKFWLEEGKVPSDRIIIAQDGIRSNYLKLGIAEYSCGRDAELVRLNLLNAIGHIEDSWNGFWKLKNRKGETYDQYILSAYDEMLWMLSLAYLLDVREKDFRKLVEVIDRDKVQDFLFEFIIRAKLKDRAPITEESYREYFGVPEVFSKLRVAISEPNKTKAEQLLKEFITKEWYKNHKDAGWYNSHKSKHDAYFGYWSFETAAVVKIMGLDDSSFRDCQYYPKDLL